MDATPAAVALRVMANARSQSTVEFSLPSADRVVLTVYDVQGKRIASIYAARAERGRHVVTWNGRDGDGRRVASGVYLSAEAGNSASVKVVLVRD